MKILSIDPGFERLGIAVLEKEKGKKELLLYSECFKTKATVAFADRLVLLKIEVEKIIKKYKPEALGIETLFMTTNQKTVMKVAEARGVVIATARAAGLDIFEYTPLQIKIAVTGYGRATKSQIISMIPRLVEMKNPSTSDDELDAIAVGITLFAYEKQ